MGIAFIEPFDQYNATDANAGGMSTVWNSSGGDWTFLAGLNGPAIGKSVRANNAPFRAQMYRAIPNTKQVTLHTAFRIDSTSIVNTEGVLNLLDPLAAFQMGFGLDAYNRLTVVGQGGAIQHTDTLELGLGIIYRMCAQMDITDDANHSITVSLNGQQRFTQIGSGLDIRATAQAQYGGVQIIGPGIGSPGNPNGPRLAFDDMVVLYDELLETGPLEITLFGPTADSAVQFARSTGANNYANVDDLPFNSDVDYNYSDTAGQKDLFTFPAPTRTPESIFCVSQLTGARKEESATRQLRQTMKIGGVDYPQADKIMSQSYQFFWDHRRTNPNSAAPWVPANLAAGVIQSGYELTV